MTGGLDSASLAKIVGAPGETSGDVYKITIGRPNIKMLEMGAPINARYWGRGPAQKLAAGVRAAVDHLARPAR